MSNRVYFETLTGGLALSLPAYAIRDPEIDFTENDKAQRIAEAIARKNGLSVAVTPHTNSWVVDGERTRNVWETTIGKWSSISRTHFDLHQLRFFVGV